MNGLTIPILVSLVACSACALTDIRRFRVPNAWTLSLLASGLIYHAASAGWPGLGLAAAGASFGFAALLVPYALGGMGAGDVKLLAGVGAWLGPAMTYDILIAAALLGGVYALVVAAMNGRLLQTLADVKSLIARRGVLSGSPVQQVAQEAGRRSRLVPFAAMVALGLFATVARL